MNIILEGPDGTGKTTFAQKLKDSFHEPLFAEQIKIIPGEGPEKFSGEINERVSRYHQLKESFEGRLLIFDRHPCVSQDIYKEINPRQSTDIRESLIIEFSNQDNFFIYFQGDTLRSLTRHTVDKESDTEEYVVRLVENYHEICGRYDKWALNNADIIIRKFSQFNRTIQMIKEMVVCGI